MKKQLIKVFGAACIAGALGYYGTDYFLNHLDKDVYENEFKAQEEIVDTLSSYQTCEKSDNFFGSIIVQNCTPITDKEIAEIKKTRSQRLEEIKLIRDETPIIIGVLLGFLVIAGAGAGLVSSKPQRKEKQPELTV